jgi:hypothetical protein
LDLTTGSLSSASFGVEVFNIPTYSIFSAGGYFFVSGSVDGCATTIFTPYSYGTQPPTFAAGSSFTSATVSCSVSTGVPQFPVASLGPLLLVALALPALLLMGRKFRTLRVL